MRQDGCLTAEIPSTSQISSRCSRRARTLRLMWIRVLLVTLACGSGAMAQQFSVGAQAALILNFARASSFAGLLTLEARGLTAGFGVRGSAGLSDAFEVALDGVYRLDGSDYGNLYVGVGLGLSRSFELRALVGFEWDIGSRLRISIETLLRLPVGPSDPRLSFALGLVYLL